MNSNSLSASLHFSPLLDPFLLYIIAFTGITLLIMSSVYFKKSVIARTLCFLAFMLLLLNPSILEEERKYIKDVAVIVVDESESQKFGQRPQRTERALKHLETEINKTNKFDLRIVKAPQTNGITNRTELFSALNQALSDVPTSRRAGVIFLTDGQIHDIPKDDKSFIQYGPVHALITGEKSEKDRQIIITKAPAYGLVGQDVRVSFRIEDTKNIDQENANVTITYGNGDKRNIALTVGTEHTIDINVENPSQNIISLEVDAVKNEVTQANNKAAVIINGVRDRLKVLLVSGVPHSGGRTWRDLLTSDPGVDLVHFTILREPQKVDYTPQNELSLIAFPFRELFEVKLYDFDLIIFDQYRVNNILPQRYFDNITRYVQDGGAFLAATGPNFATKRSIFGTSLKDILPASPKGNVIEQEYKPQITKLGAQHPVTKNLIWDNQVALPNKDGPWGSWLRYIDIQTTTGDTLMSGPNSSPLLVLDRVGQGRVAQISSDHIWLWSRGHDGGGPHSELLRRIVHWLMKEPELDEQSLDVIVHKETITITKPLLNNEESSNIVSMTKPDGEQELLTLTKSNENILSHSISADQLGIYAFEDTGQQRKFALIGDIDPVELREVKATTEKLKPLIDASGGTAIWLEKSASPSLHSYSNARRYGGSNWIAFKQNNDYTVNSVKDTSLLPEWVLLVILLSALIGLWWFEGRNKTS